MNGKLKTALKILLGVLIGVFVFLTLLGMANKRVGVNTQWRDSALLAAPPAFPSAPCTLKIVTYNIQSTWFVGKNRPERMRALGKTLTAMDPDVAGFQEAFVAADRETLMEALKESRLDYAQYFPSANIGSGLFIMSAFPIVEAYFHRYDTAAPWIKIWEGDGLAGKGVALARLALPDAKGYVDVYDTHVQAAYSWNPYDFVRAQQLREMASFIKKTHVPTAIGIALGDLNSGKGSPAFEALAANAPARSITTIETGIDHVLAVDDGKYSVTPLDTMDLNMGQGDDGRPLEMSDHHGFMVTVEIKPVSGTGDGK